VLPLTSHGKVRTHQPRGHYISHRTESVSRENALGCRQTDPVASVASAEQLTVPEAGQQQQQQQRDGGVMSLRDAAQRCPHAGRAAGPTVLHHN